MSNEIPAELAYTAEHEWVRDGDPATVGITAFAVEELGDIVFVELPAVGDTVTAGQSCGEVESTKAVADLYAPMSGQVVEVNPALDDRPELIGEDPYGEGWLYKVAGDLAAADTLDAAAYQVLIDL